MHPAIGAGMEHDFINTGTEGMKLLTAYSPPEHPEAWSTSQRRILSLILKSNYSLERGGSLRRVNGAAWKE